MADEALATLVTEVETGDGPVDGKVTLEVFLQRWLEHLDPDREAQTIRGYRFKVRKIDAKLGRVEVAKLSAQMLDRTYGEWHSKGCRTRASIICTGSCRRRCAGP